MICFVQLLNYISYMKLQTYNRGVQMKKESIYHYYVEGDDEKIKNY